MSLSIKSLAATLAIALLAGCGPRVMVEMAPGTLLPGAGTYAWGTAEDRIAGEQNPRLNNDIMVEKVQLAISTGLGKRGYKTVEKSEAAWLVHYHVGLETQTQTITDTPYIAAPSIACGAYRCATISSWGYYGAPEASTRTVTFHEGTLLVDIHDAKTNKLVWRGTLSDDVNVNKPVDQSRLQSAIDRLFARLPTVKK